MNREFQLAACVGKTGFESFALAQQVARRQHQRKGKAVTIFRCQYCGKVHTGQPNKMPDKRRDYE